MVSAALPDDPSLCGADLAVVAELVQDRAEVGAVGADFLGDIL